MKKDSLFVSLVVVAHNNEGNIAETLTVICNLLSSLVEDFEIIVVDNASVDNTLVKLRDLTLPEGLPNLQVLALTKTVNGDVAAWVGIENSLGDVVIYFDPASNDISLVPVMLSLANQGKEIIFARNLLETSTFSYRVSYKLFNSIFNFFSGIDLTTESPSYRLITKKVLNYLLRFPNPVQ